jgi:hypothetical protein
VHFPFRGRERGGREEEGFLHNKRREEEKEEWMDNVEGAIASTILPCDHHH